jgi:signal transduction histidine kinase
MDLTKDGGSGSFYILWSGLYKLTTAATIPYYTGQYSPDVQGNRRGFGFVAVGAGLDDFSRPAQDIGDKMEAMVTENIRQTTFHLIWTTFLLSVLVIIIAVWMASYLSNKLQWLIDGITHFRRGHRDFRFSANLRDEFGHLAHSFNDMAENLVQSVHAPLVITDRDLKIIYANELCLKTMGVESLNDLIGQPYYEKSVYCYGSEFCPVTALIHGREKSKVLFVERVGKFLQGVANYLTDEHGNTQGYIISSNDVTDISLKQIELERAKVEAELASQHKSRFLARMSHALRTPMNAILGLNELTQVQVASIPNLEERKELNSNLNYLKSSSLNLLLLLNDILEAANLESGDVTLVDRPFDMATMLDGVVAATEKKCAEKHLEWTTNFDFTSTHFLADSVRLRQVLEHLLNNAVKYTPEYGKVLFTVKQKTTANDKTLFLFTVKDTGIGIPADKLASVFNPFEQVEHAQYTAGSGLGLAIIRQTLELFGTHIAVHSVENQGCEFSFDIWLQNDEGTTKEASSIEVIRELFTGCKALVVDDVRLNRIVLVNLLHDAGVIVDEAKDGQEGLDMFESSPENTYDIIFMDIQMPNMNGYEAAKAIRKIPRRDAQEIPIVTISANAFREDIEKSHASGMNGHYAKPIQKGTVSEILMKFCKPKEKS